MNAAKPIRDRKAKILAILGPLTGILFLLYAAFGGRHTP